MTAKATVLWIVLCVALFGFLYGYPGYSAYALATMEPIDVTITQCWTGTGRASGGCEGTWVEPDGTAGSGNVAAWSSDYADGEVVEGVFIAGQARLSAMPWILDVAIFGPIALGFSLLVGVNYWRERRKSHP